MEAIEATNKHLDKLVTMMVATTLERYKLIPDRQKIKKIVQMTLSSKMHQIYLTVEDGEITGYIVVGSVNSDIAKKMIGNILFYDFTNEVEAKALLERAMDWIQGRRAIQLVYFSVPFLTQAADILLENGFKQSGSMIYWRRKWDFSLKSRKA